MNLIVLRKKANVTQQVLADILNVDRSTVAKWETGESFPTFKQLLKLRDFFKCSLDDLVKEDNHGT